MIWTTGLDQPVIPPKAIKELDRIQEVSSDSFSSMFITVNDNLILYDRQQNATPIVADLPPVKQAGVTRLGRVYRSRRECMKCPQTIIAQSIQPKSNCIR